MQVKRIVPNFAAPQPSTARARLAPPLGRRVRVSTFHQSATIGLLLSGLLI